MTTLTFAKTKLVDQILPDLVGTTYFPTISSYNTWYTVQDVEFTAVLNTRYRINSSVHLTIGSVTVTGSEDIAIQYQWRLKNETLGQDVPSATGTRNIFRAVVGAQWDNLRQTQSMSEAFACVSRELLIPGNDYKLYIEVKKIQVVGSPTCTLSVFDGTIYGPPPATVSLPYALQGI